MSRLLHTCARAGGLDGVQVNWEVTKGGRQQGDVASADDPDSSYVPKAPSPRVENPTLGVTRAPREVDGALCSSGAEHGPS